MWVPDLRAVTFADFGTLRRPVSRETFASASVEALKAREFESPSDSFVAAWADAMRRQDLAEWTDPRQLALEGVLASILPGSPRELRDVVEAAVERVAPSVEWFPDALPTLDYLRETGLRVALVPDPLFPLGATWLGRMKPWIDVTGSTDDPKIGRLRASVFKEILPNLGATPKQSLHVGDHIVRDVFSEKAAGMKTVLLERVPRIAPSAESLDWLRRFHGTDAKDVSPDLKIRTLEEIPAVIEQFG